MKFAGFGWEQIISTFITKLRKDPGRIHWEGLQLLDPIPIGIQYPVSRTWDERENCRHRHASPLWRNCILGRTDGRLKATSNPKSSTRQDFQWRWKTLVRHFPLHMLMYLPTKYENHGDWFFRVFLRRAPADRPKLKNESSLWSPVQILFWFLCSNRHPNDNQASNHC